MNEVSEQGPTILVIDELDGLIGKRNDSHQSEVSRQVKNLILTLTAGVASLPGIFVIGATNHPELIDTAYLDRCTKIIKMNLPTQNDKYTFFQSYMTEQGYDHTITEPEFLSLNTNLYSYRNLVHLRELKILSISKLLKVMTMISLKGVLVKMRTVNNYKKITLIFLMKI